MTDPRSSPLPEVVDVVVVGSGPAALAAALKAAVAGLQVLILEKSPWLGGTTPTGYASESVKPITVDGKTKKACKLKLLPDEAEIIYKIFDLYEQYDSLTMTETELLRQGIKTKTGRSFTRFSIKSILQNPVYLIADKDAYQYFVDNEAELFSPESDFDGIPAQSQEKGQALLHKLK